MVEVERERERTEEEEEEEEEERKGRGNWGEKLRVRVSEEALPILEPTSPNPAKKKVQEEEAYPPRG